MLMISNGTHNRTHFAHSQTDNDQFTVRILEAHDAFWHAEAIVSDEGPVPADVLMASSYRPKASTIGPPV